MKKFESLLNRDSSRKVFASLLSILIGLAVGAVVVVIVGLCKSNKEARQTITAGGLSVNDEKITDPDYRVTPEMLAGDGLLIRKGKKSYHRLKAKG